MTPVATGEAAPEALWCDAATGTWPDRRKGQIAVCTVEIGGVRASPDLRLDLRSFLRVAGEVLPHPDGPSSATSSPPRWRMVQMARKPRTPRTLAPSSPHASVGRAATRRRTGAGACTGQSLPLSFLCAVG